MVLRDRWGYVLTGDDVVAEGGRRAWPYDESPRPLEDLCAGRVRRGGRAASLREARGVCRRRGFGGRLAVQTHLNRRKALDPASGWRG